MYLDIMDEGRIICFFEETISEAESPHVIN